MYCLTKFYEVQHIKGRRKQNEIPSLHCSNSAYDKTAFIILYSHARYQIPDTRAQRSLLFIQIIQNIILSRIFKFYHPKRLQFWSSQYMTSPSLSNPHRFLIFPFLRNTPSISQLNTVVLGIQYTSLDQRPLISFVPYEHLSCQPISFQTG